MSSSSQPHILTLPNTLAQIHKASRKTSSGCRSVGPSLDKQNILDPQFSNCLSPLIDTAELQQLLINWREVCFYLTRIYFMCKHRHLARMLSKVVNEKLDIRHRLHCSISEVGLLSVCQTWVSCIYNLEVRISQHSRSLEVMYTSSVYVTTLTWGLHLWVVCHPDLKARMGEYLKLWV